MTNPFEELASRLDRIETLLERLNVPVPVTHEPDATFLTRKEAGRILGISLVTLNEWTKDGTVKGYRVGSRIRYKKSEIEASLVAIRTK